MSSLLQNILSLQLNWIDAIIFSVIILYAIEGYGLGVVYAFFDLLKFVVAFLAGLKFYNFIAIVFSTYFHMPKGYANAVGFFILAVSTEIICHFLLRTVVRKVNDLLTKNQYLSLHLSNFFGIFPGVLSGVILLMFLLTVITALPVSPVLKSAIASSQAGSFLVARAQIVEGELSKIFGGAATETLNFLTVEPQANTSISLDFTITNGQIDKDGEQQMSIAVNNERLKQGEDPLVIDLKLKQLAEDYAHYMLSHGYFSHYTPDGLSPFDRMSQRDILFQYAGENLAFSPNVAIAMQGLMSSPGHKANILSKNFNRIGIGAVTAGIYGEMFVQEFTD